MTSETEYGISWVILTAALLGVISFFMSNGLEDKLTCQKRGGEYISVRDNATKKNIVGCVTVRNGSIIIEEK